MEEFLRHWNIHGASLAIMRNDSLVYAKGYGQADNGGVAVGPSTIFRLASVSKLITAIGIMVLQERGQLSLSDKVFTPNGGILGNEPYTGYISDRRYFDITVEHLLRHSAGLSSSAGDPMFSTRTLMRRYGWTTPPDAATLSRHALSLRLQFDPGTSSTYSNYGYLLLSMIIEKVTGQPYEQWIYENVLLPAGCYDMHLGGNSYEAKYPNETRYFPMRNEAKVSKYDNTPVMVERCYGGNDITALKGAGAWVASAPEVARLVASIDGRLQVPDILSAGSIADMTAPTDSVTYALGWIDTKETGEWTRTGTLSGTSALIKYYPDGECWVMITNTSTYRAAHFTNDIAALFAKSREEFSPLLPKRNLFYSE
ncbi:MAG: beta-lactamase family protein [Bacteroidales bacterium]|nr:beta-lactamase family protein [Bacteroidales bacterium]